MLFTKIGNPDVPNGSYLAFIAKLYQAKREQFFPIRKLELAIVHSPDPSAHVCQIALRDIANTDERTALLSSISNFAEQIGMEIPVDGECVYTILLRTKGNDGGHEIMVFTSRLSERDVEIQRKRVRQFLNYELGSIDQVMLETNNDLVFMGSIHF